MAEVVRYKGEYAVKHKGKLVRTNKLYVEKGEPRYEQRYTTLTVKKFDNPKSAKKYAKTVNKYST